MNYVSQENLDNIVKGLSNKIAMSVSNGALIGDTTPVGTVISFMGTQAPLYYLVCDGTIYNIAEYQELADFIEAQFGTVNYFGGDGIDTFAVPDLRGEFLRGTGTNSHTNGGNGANVGTHQEPTQHMNVGRWKDGSNIGFALGNYGLTNIQNSDMSFPSNTTNNTLSKNVDTYDTTRASTMYATLAANSTKISSYYTSRPTNTSVLYCIKYTKAVIPSEYEDGTPIGRVIFDSILREGYIKANGAQIEDASISIPRLLSFVQKYSSQLIAPDQETYDANVGLYMYDSNNDILTLPNYIGRFLEGGNSVTSIEAGLPNIKGDFSVPLYRYSHGGDAVGGIFYNKTTGKDDTRTVRVVDTSSKLTTGGEDTVTSGYFNFKKVGLDASLSNSIYKDSITTVQPSSITLIPQIRY